MFSCRGVRLLPLTCLHFVSVYPSPSAVRGGDSPTPTSMRIDMGSGLSRNVYFLHSEAQLKLKTLYKEGAGRERYRCIVAK